MANGSVKTSKRDRFSAATTGAGMLREKVP